VARVSRRIGDNRFGPIVPVLNMQPLRPESAKELSQALQDAVALPSLRARMMAEIERALHEHAGRREDPELAESLANLKLG